MSEIPVPNFITGIVASLRMYMVPLLVVLILLLIVLWLRSIQQRTGGTEIRVYRRP